MSKPALSLLLAAALCAHAQAAVVNVAHRGNSSAAPENTLSAIDAAAGFADWVEFDIRTTADGELILMHDSTLDRTTNGTGLVHQMNYNPDITALDASYTFPAFSPEPVPTLAQAVTAALAGNMVPLIERKSGTAAQVNNALIAQTVVDQVVVQSFDWTFLTDLRALNAQVQLAALGFGTLDQSRINDILATGATTAAWRGTDLDQTSIDLAHGNGLDVFAYTINSGYQNWIDLGVDGIITDRPADLQAAIPEPTSLALLTLTGLILTRRRRG